MKKTFLFFMSLLAVCTLAFFASCSKRVEIQEKGAVERPPAPVETPRPVQQPLQPRPETTPIPQPEQIPAPTPLPEQPAPGTKVEKGPAGAELPVKEGRTSPGLMPVYFDFDQYTIRPDMVSRMEKNAAWLKSKPKVRIRIEGNTDERGSNEYNLALGQRRANSAKEYLTNLGIAPGRIEILTFGEERSLANGHDEESWKVNRRDDFLVIK